jgi:hypothetical protein
MRAPCLQAPSPRLLSVIFHHQSTIRTNMSESPRIIRKRRRPAHSCTECRRRKVRCDRKKPCGQCVSHRSPSCTYANHVNAGPPTTHIGPASEGNGNSSQSPKSVGRSSHEVSQRGSQNLAQIHGTMSKTRIFGHGHWMNTIAQVRNHIFDILFLAFPLKLSRRLSCLSWDHPEITNHYTSNSLVVASKTRSRDSWPNARN